MNVVLMGYRGCGKTSIGRKLADRLWQTFVDIDARIVKKSGKTIKEMFEQEGEAHFREVETQVLREVLAGKDQVVALGGGTVMPEPNRQILRDADTRRIYLRCEPEELLRRIQSDPATAATRPNLTSLGGGIEEIKAKLAEREPVYRELKHAELDVTNLSIDEAVVYIARLM